MTQSDENELTRAQIVPPAEHQTSVPAADLFNTSTAGVIVERTCQVRAEYRNEARVFARELAEHVNKRQAGIASVFVYEETFGTKDRIHFLIQLKSLASYYPMVLMGDQDQAYRDSIAKDRVQTDEGSSAWDRLFVDGSMQEVVLLPQFWGMYGTAVDGKLEKQSLVYTDHTVDNVPPAWQQTSQPREQHLHSGNAGIVMHRSAQIDYNFRSEARKFGREVADSINDNMAGDVTVYVYEEAFGSADRLHWMIHMKDLTSYQRLLELHVRNERVRNLYFDERIPPEKGGGTWARMFVQATMTDTALTPHHWGLYATRAEG